MSSVLIQAGYKYKESTSVWSRQDYTGIAYNDGDEIELRIASIIDNATDISVLSDELRPHCTNWPSLYHLSNTRANILRPFEADLCGDVLEIGAGLGAITRYLGECGGNVLAVEGTLRRAAIARARTRDLNNVTVVSDKFDDFQCDKKFDIVTLIGVLEYANLFTTAENPTLTLLERARSFLKPKGKLIIAIENQLGLKYFAGAPEDHFGIPMYGIEGRYRKDQAQTFGRKQIAGLIKQAGFRSCEFLAPFPDYKLPLSIITERGFSCNTFDSSALACQSVRHDPQLPPIMNFSPELAWPTIVNNELALDLSNSFLIVTSPAEEEVLVSSSTLAWHYTTGRRKELCKSTEFAKVENNQIEVVYKRLDLRASNPVIGDLLQNHLPERAGYRHGNLLFQELIQVVVQEGWRIEDLCTLLRKWLNFIATLSADQGQIVDISNPSSQLPGNFFDYIPSNIILANNGFLHVIDKEWTANKKLEVGYLTFRSLLIFFNLRRFGSPENKKIKTFYDLIIYSIKGLGWSIADDKVESWITIETKIQSEVLGSPISIGNFKDSLKRTFQIASFHQALTQRTEETEQQAKTITTLNQSLSTKDEEIHHLSSSLSQRTEETEQQARTIEAHVNTIDEIRSSTSWILSAPVRWVGGVVKILKNFSRIKNYLTKTYLFSKMFKDMIYLDNQSFPKIKKYLVEDPSFVPRSKNKFDLVDCPAKIIAFYLPQFHPIPENDDWWGKGFTEWTNVCKAKPLFRSHYQPHIPGEMGYYDLRSEDVFLKQIELAQQYGLGGFCFYFYWFAGKTLLEFPLKNYLKRKELNFPFCLCWANENWTRAWDGQEKNILIKQIYSAEDDIAFISYLSDYLKDPRYLRINQKPLIIVYRPQLLPDAKKTAKRWRNWCLQNGIGEIYLAYTQSFESNDPRDYGFDSAIEFPPNNSALHKITKSVFKKHRFLGNIFDWRALVKKSYSYTRYNYRIFRGLNPGWDNTARRGNRANILLGSSPKLFEEWAKNAIIETTKTISSKDERLIFINAWNEWAEGCHLEPDQKYGYSYLAALRQAILSTSLKKLQSADQILKSKSDLAIIIHCFYPDIFEEIINEIKKIKIKFNLFITTVQENESKVRELIRAYKLEAFVLVMENRGRDILPFLKAARLAQGYGNKIILKLHTKKSEHRNDGKTWRQDLIHKLVDPNNFSRIYQAFHDDRTLGLVGPDGHILLMSTYFGSNKIWIYELAHRMGFDVDKVKDIPFVAGSMFYISMAALKPLLKLRLNDFDFEMEENQIDGTLAHAIERAFAISCKTANLNISSTKTAGSSAFINTNSLYRYTS